MRLTGRNRPYVFYDTAVTLCATCYRRIEGKVVFENDDVWMLKWCAQHGADRVLLADDIDYYTRCREDWIKQSEMPAVFQTPMAYGCPYDCGLCPSHEQHSCLTLLEIADACNLDCPTCYAGSGTHRTELRSVDHVRAMLEAVIASEGEPDIIQISGGEPTIHPDFFEILAMVKDSPVRHLMVNTNGVRLAQDRAFAEALAGFMPNFELYLQFDSLQREALMDLRGADLRRVREQAVAACNERGISASLVVTLKRGVNDGELGSIIDWAAQQPAVRGVVVQPVQETGRTSGYDAQTHRLTLSETRRMITEQTDLFELDDLLPVPCHPDGLCMGYALKLPGGPVAISGVIDEDLVKSGRRNTILFEQHPELRDMVFEAFSTSHSPSSAASCLADLLCCLPQVELPMDLADLGYEQVFRVVIMDFIDVHNFDVRSVKRTCVHIVAPDLRIIPFDTYNMFYRDELEATRLAPLRAELVAAGLAMPPVQRHEPGVLPMAVRDR